MAQELKFSDFFQSLSVSNADHSLRSAGPLPLTTEHINGLAALPNLQNQVMTEIMSNTSDFDTAAISLALDLLLALSLRRSELPNSEKYTVWYLTTLEATVSLLTNTQLTKFWCYFESRAVPIAELAQGAHTITLLRTCRSIINRLNRVLDSELIGRVLQYLAVCKGFPHPSRLNRRSKKNSAIPSPEASLLARSGGRGLTPFKALENMADLNILGEPTDVVFFSQDLIAKFKQWYPKSRPGALELPTFDLDWPELTKESLDILVLQTIFALRGYLAELEDPHAGVVKALDDVLALRTKDGAKTFEKRLLDTEQLWVQWKGELQCRPLEAHPVPLVSPSSTGPSLVEIAPLAPLVGTIGNQELTRLMTASFGPNNFVVTNDHTDTIKEWQQSLNTAGSSPHNETIAFKIMRSQSWQTSIDRFSHLPVTEHADVAQQEEALQQKLRAANEAPPAPAKRPPSPSTEPPSKRSRLSYDDDTRRLYASERTARPPAGDSAAGPLPY